MMLNNSAHQLIKIKEIEGSFLHTKKVYPDERGNFCEVYRSDIPEMPPIVQQNQSFSYGGVIRGMHTQASNPQGKLVSCLYGTILDVIFDIRKESPTFGQGFSQILDMNEINTLYVPPGCLHGFLAMSRFAVVHYSCTSFYDPKTDGGVRWDSPEIKKYFPEDIFPIVSKKDQALPFLQEYLDLQK